MIKAIFHIDESFKWDLLLGNVRNVILASEPGYEVEVLANSEAVPFYIEASHNRYLAPMTELAKLGVHFAVCNNSIQKFGIEPKQLAGFVEIVPVGVLEIIHKQADGYAYIKP